MIPPESRTEAVNKLAHYLRRKSQPRLLLFIILVFTGIMGAVSSFLMLRAGLAQMYARYPVSALVAYLAFLLLLRLWQRHQAHQPDLAKHLEEIDKDLGVDKVPATPEEQKQSGSKLDWFSPTDAIDLLSIDDIPGFLIWLLVVAVIGGALVLLGLVLSFAPVLLAEVLLDGLLVAGIWNRFKRSRDDNPLRAAFRMTRIPALVVILGLFVMGCLLRHVAPSARSIGDVIRVFL